MTVPHRLAGVELLLTRRRLSVLLFSTLIQAPSICSAGEPPDTGPVSPHVDEASAGKADDTVATPAADKDSGKGSRRWRLRVVLPQFTALYSRDGFWILGGEYGFQLELAELHTVSLISHFCWASEGGLIGGGVGYGYELHLVKNILFIELGAAVGYWYYFTPFARKAVMKFECVEYDSMGDCIDERPIEFSNQEFVVLMLRPMLHLGYKWIFFSLGPRLAIGSTILGGATAGLTLRF